MADKKISQLTAVTTPLVGTEEVPCVQSSVTKKLTVNELFDRAIVINESGANVSFRVESDTNTNAIAVDGATGFVGVGVGSPNVNLAVYALPSTIPTNFNGIGTRGGGYLDSTNRGGLVLQGGTGNNGANTIWLQTVIRDGSGGALAPSSMKFSHLSQFTAVETDRFVLNNNGNVTVSTGNLVIGTSGKGIDFSATPGTGTSELFADYEEGTWTPVITCATPGNLTIVYDSQVGTYTKVGRQVTVTFAVSTTTFTHTTASGIVFMTGLPFAPGVSGMVPFASFEGFTSAGFTQMGAQVVATVSNLYVVISGSGQTLTNAAIGTFPTGTVKKLFGTATYFV